MPSPGSTSSKPAARRPAGGLARWAPLLAAAVPAVALAAAAIVMVSLEAAGRDRVWFEEPVTLPEAAGTRDPGMVLRLLWEGEDPREPAPVRPGILDTSRPAVTAFEAAVAADRERVLHVLEHNGYPLDEPTRQRLVCLAERLGSSDTLAYLQADAAAAVDCTAVPPAEF